MTKKYNYKTKTGRPTDYEAKKTIDKVNQYLDGCVDEVVGINKIKVKLPTIEGLALFLEVSRDTLYEWEKNHKEFSDILEKVRQAQAERLLNNGLSGDYNSTIAKLVLAKHNYVDKQELTGKDGKDLIPEEAKQKAQEAINHFLNGNNTGNSTTWWQQGS